MKKLKYKMLKTKEEIMDWLDKYDVENYTINEDLTVDVNDNVNLAMKRLKSIDVKFNIVNGYFDCSNNKLTSLDGSPKEVGDFFSCYNNQLIDLNNCPKVVGGSFNCSDNLLENMENLPEKIGKAFWCYNNNYLGELQKIEDLNEIKRIVKIKKFNKDLNFKLSEKIDQNNNKIKI